MVIGITLRRPYETNGLEAGGVLHPGRRDVAC